MAVNIYSSWLKSYWGVGIKNRSPLNLSQKKYKKINLVPLSLYPCDYDAHCSIALTLIGGGRALTLIGSGRGGERGEGFCGYKKLIKVTVTVRNSNVGGGGGVYE